LSKKLCQCIISQLKNTNVKIVFSLAREVSILFIEKEKFYMIIILRTFSMSNKSILTFYRKTHSRLCSVKIIHCSARSC